MKNIVEIPESDVGPTNPRTLIHGLTSSRLVELNVEVVSRELITHSAMGRPALVSRPNLEWPSHGDHSQCSIQISHFIRRRRNCVFPDIFGLTGIEREIVLGKPHGGVFVRSFRIPMRWNHPPLPRPPPTLGQCCVYGTNTD